MPITAVRASTWPTTRILFALAGTMTLLSLVLAVAFSPWFLLLTAFVGANQLVFVLAGACPASLVIDRLRPGTGGADGGKISAEALTCAVAWGE